MGNIVDVLPGPPAEAQLRNSEWNKSRPSNYSQASLIEKQEQNSNLYRTQHNTYHLEQGLIQ